MIKDWFYRTLTVSDLEHEERVISELKIMRRRSRWRREKWLLCPFMDMPRHFDAIFTASSTSASRDLKLAIIHCAPLLRKIEGRQLTYRRTALVLHRRQSKLLTRWHIFPKAEPFPCFQRSCSSSACQDVISWKERHPMANSTYFPNGKVASRYKVERLAQYRGSWTITWQQSTSKVTTS